MTISKKFIQNEWKSYKEKPWYCSECDALLLTTEYPECNGIYKEINKKHKSHEPVVASEPITYKKFTEIMNEWYSGVDLKDDNEKYIKFEKTTLKPPKKIFEDLDHLKKIDTFINEKPELKDLIKEINLEKDNK